MIAANSVAARPGNKTRISSGDIKVLWVLSVKWSGSSVRAVWGFKYNLIRVFTLTPFVCQCSILGRVGGKKAALLYCASLSCFGPFISLPGLFFSITVKEPFCLTRSHQQSDILKNDTPNHIFFLLPCIHFLWQILCFVSGHFPSRNSPLWTAKKIV